ncbi:endo-1,4-beta-xylanase [bacterium]|nr:endo-1,4-beta-xylanase [bacterium]
MNSIRNSPGRPSLIFFMLVLLAAAAVPGRAQVQTDVPALKDVYANDFIIGCLLSYPHIGFPDDPRVPGQGAVVAPQGGELIRHHMNSMSPGNNMKPQYTVDLAASAAAYNAASAEDRDSVDTHPVVRFNGNLIAQLNWAQRQGFTFRGHTLVWHNQTPGTGFFRTGYAASAERLSPERMTKRMDRYIGEVIRLLHEGWPGMVTAMDVVNEAVDESGSDRTTNNEWHTTYGDNSYIRKAFESARKYTILYGENQMKLYYNDYNTHSASKANGIVRICGPLFQAGVLDGIGMQEHDGLSSPTAAQWIASYDKFTAVCSEMAVTELDVTTGSPRPDSATLERQANQYGQLFKCFVERSYFSGRGKIISVSKDGLNDQYTFKTEQSSSLWTANYRCKPAFFDVVAVGRGYNTLDSLLAQCDTLQEARYTAESWADFAAARDAALAAMAANYSASISAADGLTGAVDGLLAALGGLVSATDTVRQNRTSGPSFYALDPVWPNPFNPAATVPYTVPRTGSVSIRLYDSGGRRVATVFEGVRPAGRYEAVIDGTGIPSGVYFCRMEAGDFTAVRKVSLVK